MMYSANVGELFSDVTRVQISIALFPTRAYSRNLVRRIKLRRKYRNNVCVIRYTRTEHASKLFTAN